jgi:hypothetical protein
MRPAGGQAEPATLNSVIGRTEAKHTRFVTKVSEWRMLHHVRVCQISLTEDNTPDRSID